MFEFSNEKENNETMKITNKSKYDEETSIDRIWYYGTPVVFLKKKKGWELLEWYLYKPKRTCCEGEKQNRDWIHDGKGDAEAKDK